MAVDKLNLKHDMFLGYSHSSRLSTSISTSESSCGGLLAAADGGQRGSGPGCGSSTVAILFRGLEMAPSPGASLALGWKVLGTDGDSGPAFAGGRGVRATFGATALSIVLKL